MLYDFESLNLGEACQRDLLNARGPLHNHIIDIQVAYRGMAYMIVCPKRALHLRRRLIHYHMGFRLV